MKKVIVIGIILLMLTAVGWFYYQPTPPSPNPEVPIDAEELTGNFRFSFTLEEADGTQHLVDYQTPQKEFTLYHSSTPFEKIYANLEVKLSSIESGTNAEFGPNPFLQHGYQLYTEPHDGSSYQSWSTKNGGSTLVEIVSLDDEWHIIDTIEIPLSSDLSDMSDGNYRFRWSVEGTVVCSAEDITIDYNDMVLSVYFSKGDGTLSIL